MKKRNVKKSNRRSVKNPSNVEFDSFFSSLFGALGDMSNPNNTFAESPDMPDLNSLDFNFEVIFEKIHENAIIPSYAHPSDAGMDITSVEEMDILPGKRALVHTGLRARIPDGMEIQVRPRSGLALKYGITVLNTPGTIDSGYRGEIGVILINHGEESFHINVGDRIAQIVVSYPVKIDVKEGKVDEETDRGADGFGSTGVETEKPAELVEESPAPEEPASILGVTTGE